MQENKHRPLRVMMITEFPYHGKVEGGVESAASILAKALSESPDIEALTVLNFREDISADEFIGLSDKLSVRYLTGQKRLNVPTRAYMSLVRARGIAEEFKPDVVHGQSTSIPGDLAIRLGYPSVVTIHGVGSYEVEMREKNNGLIGKYRIWMTRRILRDIEQRATVIIALSDFAEEYLKNIRRKSIARIPNAVRDEFFGMQRKQGEPKRLIYVGLLIERKNITGLLRAFRKVLDEVPDAKLDIVGHHLDPIYRQEIDAVIDERLRRQVTFHGSVSGKPLIDLMNSASALVLFSLYENLPCVIGEALALERPVIASDVGGVSEMVADGVTGIIVRPEDEQAMANAMLRVIRDPELGKKMGADAGRVARERWLPGAVAAETVKAYRQAIELARNEIE